MNIGIFFTTKKSNGGSYQYATTLINALKGNPENKYVIFNRSTDLPKEYAKWPDFKIIDLLDKSEKKENRQKENGSRLSLKTKFNVLIFNILLRIKAYGLLNFLSKLSQKNLLQRIQAEKIDLMVFTLSDKLAFLLGIPAISPLHDFEHRKYRFDKRFPEVSTPKTWQNREYIFSQIAKKSAKILVDSEIGKEDLLHFYKINPEKIAVLPFLPPDYLTKNINEQEISDFKNKRNLPEKFIFYPAQFWPHKNHRNLIKALAILKKQGVVIPLALTGAKKEMWGEFAKIENLISKNNLEKQIIYLGYVDNKEMSILFKSAIAMAMPTFFGPTNIPILEAWKMECPVLYSNIRGCRQQAGNAALLFNPENPEEMAEKIKSIWNNENLRKDLIEKGKKRLAEWDENKFKEKIYQTINDLCKKPSQK